ncbi:MAG: replication-associated recombination protein A [Oribacterium parvum]|uniref:replication-associated recombination protein A n=1 Tax=Oribacterium parvum TaxID=1501329 RepID=UPI001CAFE942|nr:replication-associated recombination protein A [Oribacterium parvum]MBF1269224.1 replication-associated recombination protein A [Oribacterium parvum]
MDLFSYQAEKNQEKMAPLAVRMRPGNLEEFVGQEHIIGENKLLSRLIRADQLQSLLFFGPPGTGKTSLAKLIANHTKAEFIQINATTAGKKDMEEAVSRAKENLGGYGRKTILFVDEIHRFNKAQQDYLLPYVEDGTVILIGATTENPYFEVNSALLSRSRLFELKPLSKEALSRLTDEALSDKKRGLGNFRTSLSEEGKEFLLENASGDARVLLNTLELAVLSTNPDSDGVIRLSKENIGECMQKKILRYDDSSEHYDTISAFIKSMRGSDPDATVYYLAKMLESGEDIRFIARRIMICASEDVGNADPQALTLAVNASLAVERVGMPEAQIILTQAACYIATAKKSNAAVKAIFAASDVVRKKGNLEIPSYLRDAHYSGHEQLGRGVGYKYPHDYPEHFVEQQYLPDEIKDYRFYEED